MHGKTKWQCWGLATSW